MPHFQNFTSCNIKNSSCNHTLAAGGVKGIFWVPKGTPHTFRSEQQKEWGRNLLPHQISTSLQRQHKKKSGLSWIPAAGQKSPLGISEFRHQCTSPPYTSLSLLHYWCAWISSQVFCLPNSTDILSARWIKRSAASSSFSPRNSALSHTSPTPVRKKDTKLQLTQSFFCLKLTI